MSFDVTWRPLEDVVDDIIDRRGVTPLKLGGDFTATGHRVISAKLIKDGRIKLDADEPRFVDETVYRKWMRTPLRRSDVIMTSEAPLGEVAYLNEDVDWVLGQRLFSLRPNSKLLDGRFLYYALQTERVKADLHGRASGSTVQGIRQAELRRVQVPVPDLCAQRSASAVLGAIDDRITLLRETNTTLKAIAQALFKSWFVDFYPVQAKAQGRAPEGIDQATAALFPDSFEDSELGSVPKGWRIGQLDDLIVLQRGFDLPSQDREPGQHPIIAASGQSGTHIAAMVKGPGVITGRSGVLGKVFLELEDFWPLNTTLWVKNFKGATPCFAYELLRMLDFKSFNAGSAVPTLNRNHIHGLPYVIPERRCVESYESLALPIHQRCNENERQAQILVAIRDALLPRLISGQLQMDEAQHSLQEVES